MDAVPYALPGAVVTYTAKSALFTAGAADRGTFFDSTGSFTITLSTTSMSAGWSAWFRCLSGTQTFDPSGAVLINGASTYAVSNAGDVVLVTYDGTNFVISQTQLPASVKITGGTVIGVTLSGAVFIGGTLSGSTLVNATLTGSTFLGGTLSGTTLVNPTITGGTMNATPIGSGTAAAGTFTTLASTNTTDATTATAAAATVAGGLGIAKNLIAAKGQGYGVTSTPTAAGTTTLTSTSTIVQIFTGSTTQTIQFPAANLFGAGIAVIYCINNQSSGTVTPTRAGADTFQGGGTTDPVLAGVTQWYASDGVSLWAKV